MKLLSLGSSKNKIWSLTGPVFISYDTAMTTLCDVTWRKGWRRHCNSRSLGWLGDRSGGCRGWGYKFLPTLHRDLPVIVHWNRQTLQTVTDITDCDRHCKLWQTSQTVTEITDCDKHYWLTDIADGNKPYWVWQSDIIDCDGHYWLTDIADGNKPYWVWQSDIIDCDGHYWLWRTLLTVTDIIDWQTLQTRYCVIDIIYIEWVW